MGRRVPEVQRVDSDPQVQPQRHVPSVVFKESIEAGKLRGCLAVKLLAISGHDKVAARELLQGVTHD